MGSLLARAFGSLAVYQGRSTTVKEREKREEWVTGQTARYWEDITLHH
jgi:hypothetical protein